MFEPTWALGFVVGDRLVRYQVVSAVPKVKDLAPAARRKYELIVSLDIRKGDLLRDGKKEVTLKNKYLVQENKDGTWVIAIQGNPEPTTPDK